MTLPPCKPDGIECPRRYIGCRAECEEYHKWLEIHEAEKSKARMTDGEKAADEFLSLQNRRAMNRRHVERRREIENGAERRLRKC